jgi:hypothetical protein
MKNSILAIGILTCMCLLFASCSNDSDPKPDLKTGKYEVKMDGKTIATGKNGDIGFVKGGEDGAWVASISKGEEISILISSVPTKVGNSVAIDGSDVTVAISGTLAGGSFLTPVVGASGSITRVSDSKITFTCTCKDLADWVDGPTYSFEGSIASEAYKILK